MFVLLFATFSTTVNAEESNKTYDFNVIGYIDVTEFVNTSYSSGQTPTDTTFTWWEAYYNTNEFTWHTSVSSSDGSLIAKNGDIASFYFNNLRFQTVIDYYGKSYYWQNFDNYYMALVHTDGSYTYLTPDFDVSDSSNFINFSIKDVEITKDVSKVVLHLTWSPYKRLGVAWFTSTFTNFWIHPKGSFTVDIQSKEAGLLSGILGWVKKTSEDVAIGFANMVKGITELPQKLWDLISEGLKNLFVPDSDYIAGYKDKWVELLSSRFGAIYQVGTIITDFVGRIQNSDKTNTINLPSVDLNSVGIPFAFGGYDIQVVPSGFETIVEICKKIISIVCTFLFINGLRKRYDEVMGVEQ